MVSQLNKAALIWVGAFTLTACASSLPRNFEYKTALRGEQGFAGHADKIKAGQALLSGGVVTDPSLALGAALPDAEVKIRRWGLVYFSKNWNRYQVVLDADVSEADKPTIKCRLVSPKQVSDAPTLPELRANKGAEVQRRLDELVQLCSAKQRIANSSI